MNIRRRQLIAIAAATAAGGAAGWALWPRSKVDEAEPVTPALAPDPEFPNPLHVAAAEGLHGIVDAAGALTIIGKPARYEILPGKSTPLLAYHVEHLGRHTLNPLLRIRSGTNLRVRYWNALDETSIVHWHGLKVDTNNDGHPHYAVGPGETYDYQFTVSNRAGLCWYHPHPHHFAGKQAYLGLAGFLIVEDDEELHLQRMLDLTLGVTDIPLFIQDKRFDAAGALLYAPGAQEHFRGYLGDTMLVNLTPRPCFDCATRLYRFRIVNGSNARIYRLAFMSGAEALEFQVIGGDGGLLEAPLPARELFLSPSERVDILLDLRNAGVGDRIVLASLAFDPMTFSGQHASHTGAGEVPPNGMPLDLMLIRVATRERFDRVLPAALSSIPAIDLADASTRLFILDHARGLWRINRGAYRMTETAFSVKRGAKEVWEFRNPAPGMPHPIHVHGFQFRVLERSDSPAQLQQLSVGLRTLPPTEHGWKDSVLLWPGETLKLLMDFSHPFPGDQVYMLQCHNLEHETHGMMVNFRVAA